VVRGLTRRYPPLVVIAWVFALSVWTVPLFARGVDAWPAGASPEAWASLAYVLVFPTVVAYLLNNYALARVHASTTAVYIFLQPVIAAVAGALVLGERLSPEVITASALLCAGVLMVVRRG
jgi:drug/metabolite transporter (DMT)-like permease